MLMTSTVRVAKSISTVLKILSNPAFSSFPCKGAYFFSSLWISRGVYVLFIQVIIQQKPLEPASLQQEEVEPGKPEWKARLVLS